MKNRNINYAERQPVWNGLGTDVSDCRSVEEALGRSGLDFTVRQADIMTDDEYPIALPGFKANIKDDGTPLGIVTTKYKVVQNEDAFSFLDTLVDDGMKFERAGGLQNGRKVFVLARMPDRYFISGESIAPYIVFINSHDGSGSIKVLMTPIRMICLNMLNLAVRNAERTWSAVHSGDVAYKLEDAKNTLIYADKYMQELSVTIDQLKRTKVSDSTVLDMVEKLIPTNEKMTVVQLKNAVSQREDIIERYFHAPDLVPLGKNAYRLINAVSDHATHAEPIRRRENYHESLFARSVEGNPLVDRVVSLLAAAA